MKNNNYILKNVIINIVLIIFSGIIYLLYEKYLTDMYKENDPTIFLGIIVIFGITFFNLYGFIFSITSIQKTLLTVIIYGLFMVSTIIIYNSIGGIVKILETKKIISECSSITFIGIIVILENIISYYIVKIAKSQNKARGNCV
jgi:4-amino-4-deoxy-L-arabinose transferase-like glycosyltransferase